MAKQKSHGKIKKPRQKKKATTKQKAMAKQKSHGKIKNLRQNKKTIAEK